LKVFGTEEKICRKMSAENLQIFSSKIYRFFLQSQIPSKYLEGQSNNYEDNSNLGTKSYSKILHGWATR